jgi:hypothetical protein
MIGPEITIPTLRATGDIVAVVVEEAMLAGVRMTIITARESVGKPPHRRWYPDPASALAYAAELADRRGLPLLDLREPDGE